MQRTRVGSSGILRVRLNQRTARNFIFLIISIVGAQLVLICSREYSWRPSSVYVSLITSIMIPLRRIDKTID